MVGRVIYIFVCASICLSVYLSVRYLVQFQAFCLFSKSHGNQSSLTMLMFGAQYVSPELPAFAIALPSTPIVRPTSLKSVGLKDAAVKPGSGKEVP